MGDLARSGAPACGHDLLEGDHALARGGNRQLGQHLPGRPVLLVGADHDLVLLPRLGVLRSLHLDALDEHEQGVGGIDRVDAQVRRAGPVHLHPQLRRAADEG